MIGTLRADVLRGKEVFSSATVSEIKENIASWSYIARGLGFGDIHR